MQEKVYEFLTAQYEEARIRETQDQETVTVLDPAMPPLKKARPRRSLIVLAATLGAFCAAVGFSLAAERFLGFLRTPEAAELREHLGGLQRALVSLRAWGGAGGG